MPMTGEEHDGNLQMAIKVPQGANKYVSQPGLTSGLQVLSQNTVP